MSQVTPVMRRQWSLYENHRRECEDYGLLPEGSRWLEPDDILQDGDCYFLNASTGTVAIIGGKSTDIPAGIQIPPSIYCYCPFGDIERVNESPSWRHVMVAVCVAIILIVALLIAFKK